MNAKFKCISISITENNIYYVKLETKVKFTGLNEEAFTMGVSFYIDDASKFVIGDYYYYDVDFSE